MRSLLAPTIVSLAVSACGGRPPAQPAPPSPVVAAPVAAPARVASEAVTKHWPFVSPPEFVAYADVGGFRAAPLAAPLVRAVVQSAADLPGNPAQHDCVAALWQGAREVAAGGGNAGFFALIRFEGAPPFAECAAAVAGTSPSHLEGASQAIDLGDGDVAAIQGDLVAIGPTSLVAAALAGHGESTALSELTLGADEYLTVRVEHDDPRIAARASLVAARDRFRLGLEGAGPDGFAEMFEHQIGDALTSDVARSNETLAHLAKEVSVARWGTHLRLGFEVVGSPDDQARDVFSATAVTIAFVRQYLTEAKKAEAREQVSAIAHAVGAWVEGDDPADPSGKLRWKKKLFSLPAVPSVVPGVTKYRSTPADWKAWEKIHFALVEPQYYQYEVVASKDGASAEVVARGDLNGDGKVSIVERTVTIDRAGRRLVFSDQVEEGDPDE